MKPAPARSAPSPSSGLPIVAFAGNPNTGKTSLFNRLTGSNARVGNYPGVTVEREIGRWRLPDGDVDVLDVPGTYSLAARSAEEQVAVRALFGLDGEQRPHVVVAVVTPPSWSATCTWSSSSSRPSCRWWSPSI